jgi:G3E family GTPase
MNPSAVLTTSRAAPLKDLLAGRGFRPRGNATEIGKWLGGDAFTAAPLVSQRHTDGITAGVIELDDEMEWGAFGVWMTMLLHRHGADVLRLKGILNIAGSKTPVAVHGVQHLVHPPVHLEDWPDADRRSRIVVITRGMSIGKLRDSLAVFSRAALRLAGHDDANIRPRMSGAGAEVGGRPYRRRGALAWTR